MMEYEEICGKYDEIRGKYEEICGNTKNYVGNMLLYTWTVGQKHSPLYNLRALTTTPVQALRLRKFKKYEET